MNNHFLIVGIAVLLICVGLSGCNESDSDDKDNDDGENQFRIINKYNIEIKVTIWTYDGCEYDDWYDPPTDETEYYTTYVDANSEKTISNDLPKDTYCIRLHVSGSAGSEYFSTDYDIWTDGHTGFVLTIHANGDVDYSYAD